MWWRWVLVEKKPIIATTEGDEIQRKGNRKKK